MKSEATYQIDNFTKEDVEKGITEILKSEPGYSYAIKNLINLIFETPRKFRLKKAGLVRSALKELEKKKKVERIEGYFRRYKWKTSSMGSI